MSAFTFFLETVGCVKNEVDSNVMRNLLLQEGFVEVSRDENPDLSIVITCSFIKHATEESLDTIFSLTNPHTTLIVTGCLPSRYKDELTELLPEAAACITCEEEKNIVSIAKSVLAQKKPHHKQIPASHTNLTEPSYAFVKISEGCSRRCSFCSIPLIRGPLVSRPYIDIEEEVSALLHQGVAEICLIGQDPASYGKDFQDSPNDAPRTFPELLQRLDALVSQKHAWLRVLYIQPDELDDELIEVFVHAKSLLPYFDIPLQHTEDAILQKMGRRRDFATYAKAIKKIRQSLPAATIRTTAMVGFPGETEEDFSRLISTIQELSPDYLATFAYSQEEGTPSYDFAHQDPEKNKYLRLQIAYDLSEELGFASAQKRVGTTFPVLLDGYDREEGLWFGHSAFQAPDTDGITYISTQGEVPKEARFYKVQCEEARCYDLFAHVLGEENE